MILVVPDVEGRTSAIEAEYRDGSLAWCSSQEGRDLLPEQVGFPLGSLRVLGWTCLDRDGRDVAVIEGATVYDLGREVLSKLDQLRLLADVGLPALPYLTYDREPPDVDLWDLWASVSLRFSRLRFLDPITGLDVGEPVPVPEGSPVTVASVVWDVDGSGTIRPSAVLTLEDGILPEWDLRSLSSAQSLGIHAGARGRMLQDYVRIDGDRSRVTWPTRCPACRTPTTIAGPHLVCLKCKQRGEPG